MAKKTTKKKKVTARKKRKTVAKGRKGRVGKRAVMKRTKPARAKKAKPMTARRKKAVSRAVSAVKERLIGKVVHYYDRIGVAIVDLKSPMSVGDFVKLKRGDEELLQRVDSMQINHAQVTKARRGDVVGIKVDKPVHEGTKVLPM